jgi:hypothetical protein
MNDEIDLASLKGIGILFDNDLHDLGKFVVKAFDARWAGTGSKARPDQRFGRRSMGSPVSTEESSVVLPGSSRKQSRLTGFHSVP